MESEKKSNGALFGSVVIIIILLIGGFFILYTKLQEIKKTQDANQTPSTLNQTVK
ncbi:MAG: hypothetical protein NT161_01140 [Candidatus Nomurabacteria bacterium]|nr:hypothetical protein [Candidatus Nomurabacteria bacterium]